MTTNQFYKQLSTWEKYNPEIASLIRAYERDFDAPTQTESGKLTKDFEQKYKNIFGSYSHAKKQHGSNLEYDALLNLYFENFPSSASRAEEFQYLESLPQDVAIERLYDEIRNGRIETVLAQNYFEEFGETPPTTWL